MTRGGWQCNPDQQTSWLLAWLLSRADRVDITGWSRLSPGVASMSFRRLTATGSMLPPAPWSTHSLMA